MKSKLIAGVLAGALSLCCLVTEQARAATYTYTGGFYPAALIIDNTPPIGTYTTSMNETGSFNLATPLGNNFSGLITPTAFSFSDGRNTITDSNASESSFNLTTDGSGTIIQWVIHVAIIGGSVIGGQNISINTTKGADDLFFGERTSINGPACCFKFDGARSESVGTWTVDAAVVTPVPAALPLFATGLGALGLLGWRRKRARAFVQFVMPSSLFRTTSSF